MGQNNSKEANPELSPSDIKAKEIANAVRNTAPITFLRDPLPTVPRNIQQPDVPETLWAAILEAEGPDNLFRVVQASLKHWSVPDLLAIFAQENNETESATQERFILRYGSEVDLTRSGWQQARLLSNMFQDELDLPGFRFGTALRRWRKTVARFEKVHRLDQEGLATARNSIFAFLHDYGMGRLVDCLQEDHANELGVQEALSTIIVVDSVTGERILYTPNPAYEQTRSYYQGVAANVRDWLIGEGRLPFDRSETGWTPSRAAWDNILHDEPVPADEDASFESIVDGTRVDLWIEVYTRGLRHIDLFGIEDFVEGFLESLQQIRPVEYDVWMARSVHEWLADGRRQRPVARLAAVIADSLIAISRQSRKASRARKSRPASSGDLQALQDVPRGEDGQDPIEESPTPKTGIKRTPSLNLGPEQGGGLEDLEDELYDLTPPTKSKPWKNSQTAESKYNELLEENTDLLIGQGELEETIRYLMEDIEVLQGQLDEDAQSQKPRVCLICGLYLMDEEAERLHMAKHRDELNKCREKNGLSPYGVDLSSATSKTKDGNSPSKKTPPSVRSSPKSGQDKPTEADAGRKTPSTRKAPLFEDTTTTPDPDPGTGLGISFGSSPRSAGSKRKRSTPPTSPDPLAAPSSPPPPRSSSRTSSKLSKTPSKGTRSASQKVGTSSPKVTTKKVLAAVEVPVDSLMADGDELLSDIVVQQPVAAKRGRKRKEPSALVEFLNTRGQGTKRRKGEACMMGIPTELEFCGSDAVKRV